MLVGHRQEQTTAEQWQQSSWQTKRCKSHVSNCNKFSPPFEREGRCAGACSEPSWEGREDAAPHHDHSKKPVHSCQLVAIT